MAEGKTIAGSVALTGRDLTLIEVAHVARDGWTATLDPGARERMAASRRTVEELVAAGQPVYGVTTGFGKLATQRIDPQYADRLQHNLLVSHAVGVGPAHDAATVRAML